MDGVLVTLDEFLEKNRNQPRTKHDIFRLREKFLLTMENNCSADNIPWKKISNKIISGILSVLLMDSGKNLVLLCEEVFKKLPSDPLRCDFLDAFMDRFLVRCISPTNNTYPSMKVTIFQISCLVVTLFHDLLPGCGGVLKTAKLKQIITAQSVLLTNINGPSCASKVSRMTEKAFLRMMEKLKFEEDKEQTIFQYFIDVCTDTTTTHPPFELTRLFTKYLLRRNSRNDPLVRTKFLKTYVFWAFESKAYRPKEHELSSYSDYLLQSLNAEEFSAHIVPVMSKMLKKSPDTILQAVYLLVKHADSLDFNPNMDMFIPILCSKLRSLNEDVRGYALNLFRYLFRKCSKQKDLLQEIGKLLDGKSGILAQFYQRQVMFLCLKFAAASVEEDDSLAELIVSNILVKHIQKEAHEETKQIALQTLVDWIPKVCGNKNPEITKKISEVFHKILKNSNANKDFCLGALWKLYSSGSKAMIESTLCVDLASDLCDSMIALVNSAQSKPNVIHIEGVLALCLLFFWTEKSSTTGFYECFAAPKVKHLLTDLIFNKASSKNHAIAFYQQTTGHLCHAQWDNKIGTVEPVEIVALTALSHLLRSCFSSAFSLSVLGIEDNCVHSTNRNASLLINLACHSEFSIRKIAIAAIKSSIKHDINNSFIFVQSFTEKLRDLNQLILFNQLNAASNDKCEPVPSESALVSVLHAIVPDSFPTMTILSTLFANFLFLSHHPLLVVSKKQHLFSHEWENIKSRFLLPLQEEAEQVSQERKEIEDVNEALDKLLEDNPAISESVISFFLGPSGEKSATIEQGKLFSSCEMEREAVFRGLGSLMQYAGNGVAENLVLEEMIKHDCVPILHCEEIAQLLEDTKLDWHIFTTDKGTLCESKGLSKTKPGSSSSSSRKKKGHATEDELWEQKVRDEVAATKKKKSFSQVENHKYTKEEMKVVHEQDALRDHFAPKFHQVRCILHCLNFLAGTHSAEFHVILPHVLSPLRSLLPVPVLSESVLEVLEGLSWCLQPQLELMPIRQDIVTANRLVFYYNVFGENDSNEDIDNQDEVRVIKQGNILPHLELFERVFGVLSQVVFGFELESIEDYGSGTLEPMPLAPPTYHMVFPLLQQFLGSHMQKEDEDTEDDHEMSFLIQEHLEWTLSLFAVHARLIPEEEEMEIGDMAAQRLLRRQMIEVVLHLLGNNFVKSRLAEIVSADDDTSSCLVHPQTILTQLCRGPVLSIGEWTPLLGDSGLLSEKQEVRKAVLSTLVAVLTQSDDEYEIIGDLRTKSNPFLTCRLFVACFDEAPENEKLAKKIWELSDCKLGQLFAGALFPLLSHPHANVRQSAAKAMSHGCLQYPDKFASIWTTLQSNFTNNLPVSVALDRDDFGLPVVSRDSSKKKSGIIESLSSPRLLSRCGVAICVKECAKLRVFQTAMPDSKGLKDIVSFVVERGLGDSHVEVRKEMMQAGIELVECYGAANDRETTMIFLQLLESVLDRKKNPNADEQQVQAHDHQREGVVILLGNVAKHLDVSDPKVTQIVNILLEALKIPSESIQRAIAKCLSPLFKKKTSTSTASPLQETSTSILAKLLEQATSAENYGERMGAAFGISAVVKGLGIAALKQHDLINQLETAMKSSNAFSRQGALFVLECLCERLGFLFEPYVIVILPILLKSFADSNLHVRDAAAHAGKKIMANLSAHGVKLVLPVLLQSLDQTAWRTKQAAIQLLGAMAYCAPRQLSSCLPQVVPKLTEALGDSHPKVRDSGKVALGDIGSVIKNPEIKNVSTTLLRALEDPNRQTLNALQLLKSLCFIHSIDAPSLALVIPILYRGLKNQQAEQKKTAALIVGNMCSMITNSKDILPYLDTLMPQLQILLTDPIPEVRGITSKAVGMLVKGMGESHFAGLVPWLLEAIKTDSSSVERSGAAQGLCEVIVSLENASTTEGDRVQKTLDEILPLAAHPKSYVREGVLWVLAFLPRSLGQKFALYLEQSLPLILHGLADEAENVREVSLRAGQVIVTAHALSHTKKILPVLENGIFDENWRIRQSSVALMGDLLNRISGNASSKSGASGGNANAVINFSKVVEEEDEDEDDEDDDDVGYDHAGSMVADRAIIKVLGIDKRNSVLAAIYMVRSDMSSVVRQSALQVWKNVISNTPRTLRQILETLMNLLVECLASTSADKRTVASRSLGEIVRKLGERVMPEVVPILRAGLEPVKPSGMRQGVCLGLAEVISCSSKKQLEDFVDTIVDAVNQALCDTLPQVRKAAAQAFLVLHKSVGYRAIDEIIPSLLHRIEISSKDIFTATDEVVKQNEIVKLDFAIQGLEEILMVRPKEILQYLIPRLIAAPLSLHYVSILAKIAKATSPSIHYYIDILLSSLIDGYVKAQANHEENLMEAIEDALNAVVSSIGEVGYQNLTIELCKYSEADRSSCERLMAMKLVSTFCTPTDSNSHREFEDQIPILLKAIVAKFADPDEQVIKASLSSLRGIGKNFKPETLTEYIDFMRNLINSMVSDARFRKGGVGATGEYLLPALCIPKSLDVFLPIYQHGLMYGSAAIRESSATGLGELVNLSSPTSLRPFLIKITGPLIRIVGDRFPSHVKAAILKTLRILLTRGGQGLKPFLPQLQTTFIKACNDSSAAVRSQGLEALMELIKYVTRVDPLVTELIEKITRLNEDESDDGPSIQLTNVKALLSILRSPVSAKISPSNVKEMYHCLEVLLSKNDEELRQQSGQGIALAFSLNVDNSELHNKVLNYMSKDSIDTDSWTLIHGKCIVLQTLMRDKVLSTFGLLESWIEPVRMYLVAVSEIEKPHISTSVLNAVCYMLEQCPTTSEEMILGSNIAFIVKSIEGGDGNNAQRNVCKSALKIVKRLSKKKTALVRAHLPQLVPCIFQHSKSTNVGVKNAAERCLLYLLEMQSCPQTLTEYVSKVGSAESKLVSEYSRRVLTKLKADSGEESD